jgi:hypothetical protein
MFENIIPTNAAIQQAELMHETTTGGVMGYDNLIKQSGLDKTTKEATRRIRKINKPRQKEEPDRNTSGTPFLVEQEQDKNTAAAPVSVQKEQGADTTGAPKEHDNGASVTPFPGPILKTRSEQQPDVLSYRDYPREPLEIEGISLEFMKKSCFSGIYEKIVLRAPVDHRHHI